MRTLFLDHGVETSTELELFMSYKDISGNLFSLSLIIPIHSLRTKYITHVIAGCWMF